MELEKQIFEGKTISNLLQEVYEKHKEINQESIIPLYEELKKFSDDKVYFLIEMFKWLDKFLDDSKVKMQTHSKGKH